MACGCVQRGESGVFALSELARLREDAGVTANSSVRCRSCGIELWHWKVKLEDRPRGAVKGVAGQCTCCKKFGGRVVTPRRLHFPTVIRLRAMGRTNAEIANLVGVTRRTVERWLLEMRREGLIG